MKVLHIISGLSSGGAEATLVRLIAGATEVQHHVLVLSLHKNLEPQIRAAGASVDYIDLKQPFALAWRTWMAWRFIRRCKPDVVQTWMYHADVIGGVLARLAGVRAISWGLHHACPDADDLGRTARICAWLGKLLSSRLPRQIIACSETTLRCHVRYGYDRSMLTVVRNGYDLGRFSVQPNERSRLRAAWGLDERDRVFGMIARYHPVKGHEVLIEALAELKKAGTAAFKCIMAGEGVDERNGELANAVHRLGLSDHVMLCGFRSDMPQVMNAIDVLVLCSHSEAFPNVLNEAMACGTPCITTDVGDARAIVADLGWVVPTGSPLALASALNEALIAQENTTDWARRQHAVRNHIHAHFSLRTMVLGYLACWVGMRADLGREAHG